MWEFFLEVFIQSKRIQQECKNEKIIFSKALLQAEEIYEENNDLKELINHQEIIRKLISYINKNFEEESCKRSIILLLESLGIIVLKEKDAENDIEMEKMQNFLNDNKVTNVLL